MMTMEQFRERQDELRRRVGRLPARSLLRRRLERELRGLVVQELERETAQAQSPSMQAALGANHIHREPHPTHWLTRWEQEH